VLYKSIYIDSESLSAAAMNNTSDPLTSMQVSISIVCSKLRITVIYFLSCVNKVSAKTLPFRKFVVSLIHYKIITFRVSHRREMYTGHVHLSVCLSVHSRMPTLLHGHGCNLGEW